MIVDERVWPDDSRGQVCAINDLIEDERRAFLVSDIVLAEAVWVLTHPLRQPKATVMDILDRLLQAANVVLDRREVVVATLAESGPAGLASRTTSSAT